MNLSSSTASRAAFEHAPGGRHRQRRQFVLALPGAQQIALAEQLGAETALDADAPDDQAIEHQQPDPAAAVDGRRVAPAPRRQRDRRSPRTRQPRARAGAPGSPRRGRGRPRAPCTARRRRLSVLGFTSILSKAHGSAGRGMRFACHVPYPKRASLNGPDDRVRPPAGEKALFVGALQGQDLDQAGDLEHLALPLARRSRTAPSRARCTCPGRSAESASPSSP